MESLDIFAGHAKDLNVRLGTRFKSKSEPVDDLQVRLEGLDDRYGGSC